MRHISENIIKIVVMTCLIFGVLSCNEDKGTYDYVDINTVKIDENISTNITAMSGAGLKWTPKLEFSQIEKESDFTFNWYYRLNKDSEWVFLQEGRDLDTELSGDIGAPRDTPYDLLYEVFNTKTQIPYWKTYKLTVVSPFTIGYAALCEHDNGFDIDMVSKSTVDGKFSLHKNVLEKSGSELPREGVKPYDILAYEDPFAPDPYEVKANHYSMFILTDRYTTRIYSSDYSWKPSYDISNIVEKGSYLDKEYVKKGKPVIAQKMKVSYMSANEAKPRVYFYHKEPDGKGNWYLYSSYGMMYLFSVQMNSLRTEGTPRYEPAPYVGPIVHGSMYYDMEKKAFRYGSIEYTSYSSKDIFYTDPIPAEPDGAAFNYSDPNDGLLYMDNIGGDDSGEFLSTRAYAILKQTDGTFKYIEYGAKYAARVPVANIATKEYKQRASVFAAGSHIGNAKFFARAPQLLNSPFLYYVTQDNRIYKADISSATAVEIDITSSILRDGSYSEVTVFKYLLPEANYGERDLKRALAVGTYNPSLGKEKGGKLELFVTADTSTGDLKPAWLPAEPKDGVEQAAMSWTGLGKIVGLTYKQK